MSEQERGCGVAQVVETDPGQPCSVKGILEGPRDGRGVVRLAQHRGEHVTAVYPAGACDEALHPLPGPVRPKRGLHYDGDFEIIADVTGQATRWAAPRGTL